MLNRRKEPILSICIPTYNRCEKVYKLVNDILLYPGQEIEVVVLDNCSTDETSILLSKIIDKRFRFIENEENIGGILNPLKAIGLGSGLFSMLCLDKDYLDFRGIHKLLDVISLDQEVVLGYCELNIQKDGKNAIYDRGYSSVINMAYLSRHPSGMFYRTNEYINSAILKDIFLENNGFPFNFDLINAEMAMIGKSQKISLPTVFTETKMEASKSPSFTYHADNVYFSPAKRLVEFDTYLDNAQKLKLSVFEIFKLTFKLYGHELWLSTFGYKNMISDPDVCLHNRIARKDIGFRKLWKLNFMFSMHFFKKDISINKVEKLLVILWWDVKFFAKLLMST